MSSTLLPKDYKQIVCVNKPINGYLTLEKSYKAIGKSKPYVCIDKDDSGLAHWYHESHFDSIDNVPKVTE